MAGFLAPLLELAGLQVGIGSGVRVPGPVPVPVPGAPSSSGASADEIGSGTSELSKDRSRERVHERDCKCAPDKGAPVIRNWNMSAISRAYQDYVTGVYINSTEPMPAGTEWSFAGRDFDGFRSTLCQLEEAKAKYDQFFKPNGTPKRFFDAFSSSKIITQARAHNVIAAANTPAKIRWFFMQPKSYRYFSMQFRTKAPLVATEYKPMLLD
ncbi:restriction endonuclease fold toxin 5 domain-containing protein [Paraburkholderia metrosideri]|uniref:Tox-REase-5 domain-containing protein n=1 Tax=Paraburkholderia metrosideri TaxID=580937 RepID=A0ABN7HJT1_9BURK|nr:restriction endonuclease fold toxin 5 domain-containing protein [Paraburkholderia metrosideri]CAD6518347.1 hypothetical protein LMG28140_01079 [Paraburkholderia metrosideri]